MDLFNALEVATDEFGRRVAAVAQDGWIRPTPCTDWDVQYLTAHVGGGNRFAVLILGGMSASDAIDGVMSSPQLGADPLAAWASTSAAQLDAFRGPGVLERRVDHPLGEVTGRTFLEFRVFDVTLPAWDLARSIGEDEQLDVDLVHTVLDIVENGPAGMGFGITALASADVASPRSRLLDLTGRR
jgi:uncharacterized protein (TIGR03086 family)